MANFEAEKSLVCRLPSYLGSLLGHSLLGGGSLPIFTLLLAVILQIRHEKDKNGSLALIVRPCPVGTSSVE